MDIVDPFATPSNSEAATDQIVDPYAATSLQSKEPQKFQMEPGLEEVQSGRQNTPEGVNPNDLGINDAGQYVNMKTGEIIPEQKETRTVTHDKVLLLGNTLRRQVHPLILMTHLMC